MTFLHFLRVAVQRNQCGQGLLEAIVALTVIATGLVGALNLTLANQTGAAAGEDRLLAANLAREGVEVVRNIRDSNWLARATWDSALENGVDYTAAPLFDKAANSWTLNFTPNTINHNYARLWRAGGVYFQSTLNPPPGATLIAYRRLLTLDEICQDKSIVASGSACNPASNPKIGIRVRSQVQWVSKGTHNLTAEEWLFNWR